MSEENFLSYKDQFKEVYVSHFSRMKRFAQQYVVHEEDAENIVQDLFFDLLDKKVKFASYTNLSGYLYTLLKNRCIDFLRRKTVEQNTLNAIQNYYIMELNLKLDSLMALDNSVLTDKDVVELIYEAIEKLPEKCKEIFILNKLEGKKQKNIAQELSISVNTVESQMAIAYKKLKEILKDRVLLFTLLFI